MATVTPTPSQFPQWEFDLLKGLNAPTSVNNLTALNLWAQSEGNVINNPLAASGQGAGASKCVAQCGTGSPVYEYSSESAGVAFLVNFLGGSNWTGIVHAFQQDAGLGAIFQAINSSKWCAGCQGGKYPEALAAAAGGGAGKVSSGVGTGSGGTAGGGSGGAATTGSGLKTCLWSIPTPSSSIVSTVTFGLVNNAGGSWCILTKGNVKWMSGALALVAGSAIGAFGVVLLAAWGFDSSGAKGAVAKVAGSLPVGPAKIARAAGASGARSKAPTAGLGPASAPPRPATTVRESLSAREGERRLAATERQQGPIGPRGRSTNTRRGYERYRTTSVAGAPRRIPPAGSAERRRRAEQPF